MTEEHFIGHAIKDMVENEVTVLFNKRTNVSKHDANYFSVEKPTKPTFIINYFDACLNFSIFLHEYCHFLQWKSGTKIWKEGIKSLNQYYEWLDKKLDTCEEKHVTAIQALELDADRRVVNLIKKHKFDINIDQYIKESNAYALTFYYVWLKRDHKKFPINYNSEEIMEIIPKRHFTIKGVTKKYPKIMELFENSK